MFTFHPQVGDLELLSEISMLLVPRARLFFLLLPCRSAKDVLESSLFEAQQLLSQLGVTKGQLEMQLQTVTQAKEVLQGKRLVACVGKSHGASGV